jgi:hypothetical protein
MSTGVVRVVFTLKINTDSSQNMHLQIFSKGSDKKTAVKN